MQDFPIRFSIVSDAYSAGRTWLTGESDIDTYEARRPSIDLGNGTHLSAADVVDSHFERMLNSSEDSQAETASVPAAEIPAEGTEATDSRAESKTSPDKRSDDLQTSTADIHESQDEDLPTTQPSGTLGTLRYAISRLAPQLLPLVQLAEELLSASPPVSPKTEFRSLLLAALQAEHKQNVNKMAIGIQQPESDANLLKKVGTNKFVILIAIPVALAIFFWLRHALSSQQAGKHSERSH